jgi:hypothetical protein
MNDDDAGDSACWLDQVCDVCGGFIENRNEHRCRPAVTSHRAVVATVTGPRRERDPTR